ncbi:GrpE-domain-containing protein [Tribonema minus]|uniref:GrpE-domain-containing protein n=1 Tax=Tribonema minus TaxID=303371 RepID=A0A835ZD01_9STRA|nr:GrpE-domain-containing protein [Tribonema minus]
MAKRKATKEDEGKQEAAAEEGAAEVDASATAAAGTEVEAKEEAKPDPNAAVKAEIKELEDAVRKAEARLAAAQESIKEKGKTGYVRLAAEVDNYRKRRNLDQKKLQAEAMARVLRSFEPVLEAFEAVVDGETDLKLETEQEQMFNSNYQALYRQLADVYTKLGVTDFFGVQGETYDGIRHEKVGEQHADIRAGAVLECLAKGNELSGGVIRKAKVVTSLGPEKPAAEKAAAKEGDASDSEEESA